MVEGSPSPCGRDVTDRRQPISCTDKRSELFEFPLRKTAGERKASNSTLQSSCKSCKYKSFNNGRYILIALTDEESLISLFELQYF